jgi:benzoate membrane transport protein
VSDPARREAAAVTFVVTAAGVGFVGIGAAFWGLLAGVGMTLLHRRERPAEVPAAR